MYYTGCPVGRMTKANLPLRSGRFPRIRACLFDMDGLLLDTEDRYTMMTNEILQIYGKPSLPWFIKAQLQGRPAPEVGTHPPFEACSSQHWLTEI